MDTHENTKTPVGLAPSADSPATKRKKLTAGRLGIIAFATFAILAFAIYILIFVYGSAVSG